MVYQRGSVSSVRDEELILMTDEYVFDWCFDLVFYTPFETDLIGKIRTTHLFDHVLIYVLLVTDFTKLQK